MKKLFSYAIPSAVSLAISIALLCSRGAFTSAYADSMKFCSDAFFVPAVLMIGFWCLLRVADTGFFDMLTYGVKSLLRLFTPFDKKVGSGGYYEYKLEMAEKRKERAIFLPVLFVGLADLVISFVFLGLYYV